MVAATPFGAAWLADDRPSEGVGGLPRAAYLVRGIERLRELLASPDFVAKAPATVVERERARLAQLEDQLRQLRAADGG